MKSLIVFDLDFTLWNAGGTWCDHLVPPFGRQGSRVMDARGARIELYPEVDQILSWCRQYEHSTAIASRTGQPSWARRLLDLLEIRDRFRYEEIYPGCKQRHFQELQRKSDLPFDQMFFFDDEYRNIRDVREFGVRAIHVPEGISWDRFEAAVSPR